MFCETLIVIILIVIGIVVTLIITWVLLLVGWLLFGDIIIRQLEYKEIRDTWRQEEEE